MTWRDTLLKVAAVDPSLSLKARGLLAYLAVLSTDVPTTRELAAALQEGRDSIRGALNELIEHGYVDRRRFQDGLGRWTFMSFVSPQNAVIEPPSVAGIPGPGEPSSPPSTVAGFSGHNTVEQLEGLVTSTRDQYTTKTVKPKGFTVLETRLTSCQELKVREDILGYDFFESTEQPVDDPAPVKAKIRRSNRDVASWNAYDLSLEFQNQVWAHDLTQFGQTNLDALRGTFARIRKSGVTSEQCKVALEEFFADPRNIVDPGQGAPLWKRFITWYTSHQTTVAKAAGAVPDEPAVDPALTLKGLERLRNV
jgi:hypothetical protein